MKPKFLAISVLLVVLGLSACGGAKATSVPVSASDIARLPADKTFEIDLTRNGSVYVFDDKDTDFSRVTMHTASGVQTLADLLTMSDMSPEGGLVVGTLDDMGGYLPIQVSATKKYNCGVACKCDGRAACREMRQDKACVDKMACNKETGSCTCVAKP
jgi:hypothetical protein